MAIDLEEEYDKIYRYCYFHVREQYLAEDITQETFLRYFKRAPQIIHGSRTAYLYTIARNLCTDYFRRTGTEELTEEKAEAVSGTERPMEGLEDSMDLKQALKTLTVEQQELLMLRYAQELNVSEAARILGISRFAFYRREKEALKMLKLKLEGGDAQ